MPPQGRNGTAAGVGALTPHPESASGRRETGRKVRGPAAPVVWPLLFPAGGGKLGGDLQQCCGQSGGPGMGVDQLCRHGSSTFSSFFSMALKPPGRGLRQQSKGPLPCHHRLSSRRSLSFLTTCLVPVTSRTTHHYCPKPALSLSSVSSSLCPSRAGCCLQHLRCVSHGE